MKEILDKISVIVPCYNVESIVSRCLDSILSQSIGLEYLEIILIDDASTDNTLEVLKQYEKQYPEQILLIASEINGKQGTARNIGLEYASGTYISFVDSDDMIHKDMYKILLEIINATDSDIVQFRYKGYINAEDVDKSIVYSKVAYKVCEFYEGEGRRNLFVDDSILNQSCTTKIYRKSLLDEACVSFAECVSYEEPLFTYPLKFFVKKVAVVELPLYFYIYNESGTTAQYMADLSTIMEHLEVQCATIKFARGIPKYCMYKQEVDFYFIHTFYIETFWFFKYRNANMPIAILREMVSVLEDVVPEYMNNKYISDSNVDMLKLGAELKNADDVVAQSVLDCFFNVLK